jgi:tetratricopeptide (TPR) repeat protein
VAQSAIEREYGAGAAQNFTLLGKGKSRLKMPKDPANEPIIDLGEPENIGLPANLCMVDRGAELVEISERFEQANTRLVCLHGIGGIGKSYIAIEAAHRNAWRFPNGIIWLKVETTGFQLADICRNIAYLLEINLNEMSEEQLRNRALDAISMRKCLIILDNAETIPPDERKRISGFLGGFDPRRGSKALVTSRAAIAEFEQLDGAAPIHPVGKFDDFHAEQLLYEEATRRNLWTETKSKVNEFLKHGRGHPFLLSRSVAWAKDRGVEPALRDLVQLKGSAEDASKELVGKMVDGLNEPGRCVLRIMPIFEGGADEPAINAVCGEITDEGIRELTQSGLLDYGHQMKRYSLHQLVADYVIANMPLEGNEERTARQRHAQHYAKAAEKYNETPMEQWRVLDVDWENIRSGANFSVRELARAFGVDDEPISLRNLLAKELSIEGHEEQIQLAGNYSWALNRYVYWRRSEYRLRWMLSGAVAFRAQDDKKRLATTYNNIGLIYDAQGNYEEALQWYQKSVEITEQIGDRAILAATYNNIGEVHKSQGNYEEALQWYQKSVEITEQIGDWDGLATTYNNIGLIYHAQGSYKDALEWYKKSLEIRKQIGDKSRLAMTYSNIGSIYNAKGSYNEALEWFKKSVEIKKQIGDTAGLATIYNNIGSVYYAQGSYADALEWLKKSVEISERIGDREVLAGTLHNMGYLEMERGELQRALEYFNQSRDLYEQIGLEKHVVSRVGTAHQNDPPAVFARSNSETEFLGKTRFLLYKEE